MEEKKSQDTMIAAIQECVSIIVSEVKPIGMQKSISELEELIKTQNEKVCSTLVVVGDTGSGKSSLLNALLNESELLPTNGSGNACTGKFRVSHESCFIVTYKYLTPAAIIELGFDKTDHGACYSAVVEFISEKDWNLEVEKLLSDQKETVQTHTHVFIQHSRFRFLCRTFWLQVATF